MSYLRCNWCNKIEEWECTCEYCRSCYNKFKKDAYGIFECTGRCKGDAICYDCSDEHKCDNCDEIICENCVGYTCSCGTWCIYCESEAVCYSDDENDSYG